MPADDTIDSHLRFTMADEHEPSHSRRRYRPLTPYFSVRGVAARAGPRP